MAKDKPKAAAKKTAAAPEKKAAPKAEKTEEKPAKKEEPTFKYGVKDLATALGIKEASVRVRLRANEIPKAGKSYGWNSKTELEEVIKAIKSDKKAAAKAEPDDDDGDEDADEDEGDEDASDDEDEDE